MVKDNDSSRRRFSDSVLDQFINEGQRDVINRTWAIRNSDTVTLVAQTTYYDLNSDVLAIDQVIYTHESGNRIELEEVAEHSFIEGNPKWESNSGTPAVYFTRISTDSGTALEIAFHPIPTSSSTGTVRVDYFASASDMSSDSDVPFNGLLHLYSYHESIVWYVVGKIAILERMTDLANSAVGIYTSWIEIMNDRLGRTPNRNASFQPTRSTR